MIAMLIVVGGMFVAWMLVKAGDDFDNTFEDEEK